MGHRDVVEAGRVEPDCRLAGAVEDVIHDQEVGGRCRDDDLARAPGIGADECVVRDGQPRHDSAVAIVALDRPAVREVVEHVVADDDVVAHAVIDAMIVVLPIGVRGRAAFLTRAEPSDVVDEVALDREVARISVDANDAPLRAGAHVPDVVHVILCDHDVVPFLGIDSITTRVADLEPFHPDVATGDFDGGGGCVVATIDHGGPAMRCPEYQPASGRSTPADRHHLRPARIDAVIDDDGIAGSYDVGGVLNRAPGRQAGTGVPIVAQSSVDVEAGGIAGGRARGRRGRWRDHPRTRRQRDGRRQGSYGSQ